MFPLSLLFICRLFPSHFGALFPRTLAWVFADDDGGQVTELVVVSAISGAAPISLNNLKCFFIEHLSPRPTDQGRPRDSSLCWWGVNAEGLPDRHWRLFISNPRLKVVELHQNRVSLETPRRRRRSSVGGRPVEGITNEKWCLYFRRTAEPPSKPREENQLTTPEIGVAVKNPRSCGSASKIFCHLPA